jgi:spore germination cell wall hydrolase CwlJ-like protein
MSQALPQLLLARGILASAMAAGLSLGSAAAAQSAPLADGRAAVARYLPPPLTGESPQAAAQCLALAIAYEAGLEPLAGQEAVAQVILNRVRHAAYPDTACGVVWQGSARRSGCQFTFTCDGSLRRARSSAGMAAAQAVATRVLAGESPDHVRGATHYHADYVTPYWAPSLARVRQIAAHVFYRAPGTDWPRSGVPLAAALSAPEPLSAPPRNDDPAIRDGQFAPWGLAVGPSER